MGGFAARKALTVVEHVEHGLSTLSSSPVFSLHILTCTSSLNYLPVILCLLLFCAVLGIELLAACQALDFHHEKNVWQTSPDDATPPQQPVNTTTEPLEKLYATLRSVVR